MKNRVQELIEMRKQAVEAESAIIDSKIKASFEETRKAAEQVLEICFEELSNKAKEPYSGQICADFDCENASSFGNDFFKKHLWYLPNLANIYAFKYLLGLGPNEAKSKIYFDLEYFKELVKLNDGLVYEESHSSTGAHYVYKFKLKLDKKVDTIEEYIKTQNLKR